MENTNTSLMFKDISIKFASKIGIALPSETPLGPAVTKLGRLCIIMKGKLLGQEDPLEEGMVTDSSILAWRIPRTEEPGQLQSMGLQRAGHD